VIFGGSVIVNYVDISMWCLAFVFFLGFLYALMNVVEGADLAGLFTAACAAFCILLCFGAWGDSEHRMEDRTAQRDFVAAGYTFKSVNREHARMAIGNCLTTFDVHKVNGVYRPTIPAFKNGRQYNAVITSKWQKKTSCPAPA
jgi:hypothetical protein